jgi:RNA polymerase sigma-70 factor (ECF subfamily)
MSVGRLPAATVKQLVIDHYEFIWRLLARSGVAAPDVDDAAQQVFMVLVTRADLVIKPGSERAFLYGISLRVTKEFRRRAQSAAQHTSEAAELPDERLDLEAMTEQSLARKKLDAILVSMPDALREAFILFELEDMSVPEIATLLGIPTGTAASRLRRSRELFQEAVIQLRADAASGGQA